MSFSEIVLLSIALAADAVTVGLAVGINHKSYRQVFRLAFHCGLFQALLPTVSAVTAVCVGTIVDAFDHYIGFALLALIGAKTIHGSIKNSDVKVPKDLTKGMSMVGLSLAVSIDAFAAGFPIGFSNTSVLLAVFTIGTITATLTAVAMKAASSVSTKLGSKAEFVAGIILILLGVKILLKG